MAATIVSRAFGAGNDKAVSLANSSWARPITLPATWSKIRLGVHCEFVGTGANLLSGTTLAMGFCSGVVNQFIDATTTHFVGMMFGDGINTWYYSDANNYQLTSGSSPASYIPAVKYGTTLNVGGTMSWSNASIYWPTVNGTTANRGMLIVDITKGSPNYTFTIPFYRNNTTVHDNTSADFLTIMAEQAPIAPSNCYAVYLMQTRTLAVSEATYGTLNAINVSWNRADAPMEIYDVAWAVLA